MSIGAFAVVAARERELGVPVTLENLAGFGWERPLLGVSMWAFMLGFAGFPLTGGFVGKFYVFAAAYDHGWTWLVIVGVARDARQPLLLPRRRPRDVHAPDRGPAAGADWRLAAAGAAAAGAVVACLVVTVGSFFAVQPLIDLAKHAADSLPF